MIRRIALTGVVAMALLAWTGARADSKKHGGAATLMPVGDLKWTDVPDHPGVKLAATQGDPNKGAAHFFVTLKSGFSAPLHHHSPDHYVTVLAGTLVLNVDGKDYALPAGSFFAFTGKKQHTTKCQEGADCVLAIDARGKWDVVEEKPKS